MSVDEDEYGLGPFQRHGGRRYAVRDCTCPWCCTNRAEGRTLVDTEPQDKSSSGDDGGDE